MNCCSVRVGWLRSIQTVGGLYNLHDMIRVRAPSRLHFGLLGLSSLEQWPNLLGEKVVPSRRFGGAGLMIQDPGIELTAQPADDWAAEGALAERALEYARHFARTFPPDIIRPHRLVIERAAPEHAGLGTGTQLGLAVARALGTACGLPDPDALELGRRAGRGPGGSRSAGRPRHCAASGPRPLSGELVLGRGRSTMGGRLARGEREGGVYASGLPADGSGNDR